ncbi:MAG: hypothetical protein M3N52_11130 [Actinomycetota bacterium]|nr:hypothetical protein [Actinomycetota bacterium]
MATLDEKTVEDLLFGDTDPRELALLLAQKGLTMDPVERDQRVTILNALNTHATRQMAVQTAKLATGTRALAIFTAVLALTGVAVAIAGAL